MLRARAIDERVLAAIEQVGYAPDGVARSLRRGVAPLWEHFGYCPPGKLIWAGTCGYGGVVVGLYRGALKYNNVSLDCLGASTSSGGTEGRGSCSSNRNRNCDGSCGECTGSCGKCTGGRWWRTCRCKGCASCRWRPGRPATAPTSWSGSGRRGLGSGCLMTAEMMVEVMPRATRLAVVIHRPVVARARP